MELLPYYPKAMYLSFSIPQIPPSDYQVDKADHTVTLLKSTWPSVDPYHNYLQVVTSGG